MKIALTAILIVSAPWLAPAAAPPQEARLRVSPETVNMGTFYGGATVRVEGVTGPDEKVVIVVRGGKVTEVFNKVGRVGPIWVNTGKVTISGVPSLLLAFSSEPLGACLTRAAIDKYGLDLPAIHEDLSFRQRRAISRKVRAADEEEHRLFERDPFIYFYEGYLRAYDKETSKGRGVYYTPPPIVNFIVRAVDDILKASFDIRDGLAANRRVTVLDFACGTGTFLLEVFQRIFDNIGGPDSGRADLIVRDHLLKNLFGFEYLIAPYTIAHLKLSQYLKDQNHPLKNDERLQVFLTNTLEPIHPEPNFLLPAITAETEAAQTVKDQPILVITGNPPYSGHSKNKGPWITAAIDGYKFTIELDEAGREIKKPLGERNPKWLNDDYVKFIRFAQLKMDAVAEGVVGIITNHSWLDNPTFRGMRQSLMRSFQQIYVLDLHGNAKKKESAPDGSKDENVFDIEQGVAISLFVKRPGLERGVWRGDLWANGWKSIRP